MLKNNLPNSRFHMERKTLCLFLAPCFALGEVERWARSKVER